MPAVVAPLEFAVYSRRVAATAPGLRLEILRFRTQCRKAVCSVLVPQYQTDAAILLMFQEFLALAE